MIILARNSAFTCIATIICSCRAITSNNFTSFCCISPNCWRNTLLRDWITKSTTILVKTFLAFTNRFACFVNPNSTKRAKQFIESTFRTSPIFRKRAWISMRSFMNTFVFLEKRSWRT